MLYKKEQSMKTIQYSEPKNDIFAALINAILITLVIIYVDEGFNSMHWIYDYTNWLMIAIYVIIIFPSQYLLSKYLFSSMLGYKKIAAVALLGFPITLFALWWLFNRKG